MDNIEDLKDKLNKHLTELKSLFGEQNAIDEDENENDFYQDELEDENNLYTKLDDQLKRLRKVIEQNRMLIVGDLEDVNYLGSDGSGDEDEDIE